jgi:hypothetical protein
MATNPQLRRIHFLLRETNLQEQKPALVLSFSKGRSGSSKELSYSEANELILYLEGQLNSPTENVRQQVSANQMRRKIISICHNMKWENPDGAVDMARLNEWCLHKSYLKKSIQQYSYKQLPKLVSQLQEVYNWFITNINNV